MGEKEGRKQIKKSVYCTPEEIADIEAVEKKGVQVYAQMVPNDEEKDIPFLSGLMETE